MILLEKKILIFSTISGNVCSFLYNLLTLIPGQILFNLRRGEEIIKYLNGLKIYGLPLKIFNENYKIYPLVSLFEIDQIEEENKNYIMGTTNHLILNETFNNQKVDLIINLDTEKIIPLFKPSDKKEIFELTKTEKNIYSSIENKLNKYNINYSNTKWLNSLKEMDIKKFLKEDDFEDNGEIALDDIDEYIRNEFKKYFKDFLSLLSLCLTILKNNSIVKYLDIPKETVYSQFILDEETIKKIYIKIIPNINYIKLIINYTKTKSFLYWVKDHDKANLFYLNKFISSDKVITVYNEDGNTYLGKLKNGLPDGYGTLSNPDNSYLYNGEWKDGLKHGKGQLITDNLKYSGLFENDVFCGAGGVLCDSEGNIYEGDFLNGKYHGYGHYKLVNGDVYIGQFKYGLFDGRGQLMSQNGDVFDGNFLEGKKDGFGLMIKSDGEKIEGEYKDGVLVKEVKNYK